MSKYDQGEARFIGNFSQEQVQVLNAALDMYSRVGMGQLEVAIGEEIQNQNLDKIYPRTAVRHLLYAIKEMVWGFSANASYGIYAEEVPVRARTAYDLKQIMRKAAHDLRMATESDEDLKYLAHNVDSRYFLPSSEEKEASMFWTLESDKISHDYVMQGNSYAVLHDIIRLGEHNATPQLAFMLGKIVERLERYRPGTMWVRPIDSLSSVASRILREMPAQGEEE